MAGARGASCPEESVHWERRAAPAGSMDGAALPHGCGSFHAWMDLR